MESITGIDWKSYVFAGVIAITVILYGFMILGMCNSNLDLPGILDTSGYSRSTPIAIGLSGFALACVAGIYAYAQINSKAVFAASIVISCIVLMLTVITLGVTAITH